MFHTLNIKNITKETSNSVSIEFEVPLTLLNEFSFKSGQFLTLKKVINGEDIRRSYSLCSTPKSGQFKVVVKQIPNGKFSTFANKELKAGDQIEIGAPNGSFFVETNSKNTKSYTLIAAGSGITPIFSILKSILVEEPNSTINLFYGNKSPELSIFKEEIEQLKKKYSEKLTVHFIYSQIKGESRFHTGRLEGQKIKKLFKKFAPANLTNEVFICGPQEMTNNINNLLENKFNFEPSNIHYELFTANVTEKKVTTKKITIVNAILDGENIEFKVKKGESILEAGLAAGYDIPFSCQGGVCGVCKCMVGDGTAEMENNIALSDDEVESGAVLSCQARVLSPNIKITFDT
ncbi:MAG: 2Fe-2S iron-sulfur cluster-binding protein [Flavobacteriales bacterium]